MPKYYLLDENKNLVEGFDKEGFLALLEQAIEQGSLENIDPDSAVASKLRSVLNGSTHHIEFVTQAQYNQLVEDEELVPNTYYFITDDTTAEDIEQHLNQTDAITEELRDDLDNTNNVIDELVEGTVVGGDLRAKRASKADTTDITNSEWHTLSVTTNSEDKDVCTIPNFSKTKTYLFAVALADNWTASPIPLGMFSLPPYSDSVHTTIYTLAGFGLDQHEYRGRIEMDTGIVTMQKDNSTYQTGVKRFYYKEIK